jgi:hypothetical protein
MDPPGKAPAPADQPRRDNDLPAYTPGFGRRLLMFLLCLVGLIIVWTFFLLNARK